MWDSRRGSRWTCDFNLLAGIEGHTLEHCGSRHTNWADLSWMSWGISRSSSTSLLIVWQDFCTIKWKKTLIRTLLIFFVAFVDSWGERWKRLWMLTCFVLFSWRARSSQTREAASEPPWRAVRMPCPYLDGGGSQRVSPQCPSPAARSSL